MKALLLDTHVWIWLVTDMPRMSEQAFEALERGAERNALAVSEASFWEIAVKASKGKLDVPPNAREWLKRASRMPGLGVIQIDREVMVHSAELDIAVRDPADRMLIATALRYDLTLATADTSLIKYANDNRDLSVLDCRLRSSA